MPAIVLLIAAGSILAGPQSSDPYPLAVGNQWVYQGHVTFPAITNAEGKLLPPRTKQITFRSTITKVVCRKNGVNVRGLKSPSIAAAALDNSPFGTIAWNQASRRAILLSLNSSRFYLINYGVEDEAARILHRVENPQDSLADLLRDTPILVMPLTLGKRWGVPFDEWSVIGREHTSLRGVKGIEAAENLDGFILQTGTNTGKTRIDFVPGVGITRVSSESLFKRGDPNHWEFKGALVGVQKVDNASVCGGAV